MRAITIQISNSDTQCRFNITVLEVRQQAAQRVAINKNVK